MLAAPAFTEIEGVTLFRDDLLWYKFYPLAPYPRIRVDENGHPIFLLIKYAFSDQDRENNPKLPPGGGYVNFDIEFDVPSDVLERVRAKLQESVKAEWDRLRNGTDAEKAMPGVAGTTEAPKVEFGTPTWTSGKVALDAPQAKELVNARITETTPSLLSSNIAVFSMDLTSAGATFMQKTLLDPEGAGASDLIPIQVAYDLTFWARLPPVNIHIKADSQKIHEYLHKVMEGRGTDYCTTYDFSHTDITDETASMTGFIDVKIDPGSASLSNQVIEELRKYSLELVKEMIQASFFTDKDLSGHGEDSPGPGTQPGETPPSSDTNPKKYLKQSYDAATMHIELNLEQRSVIEWPIHPQTTLQPFFKGLTAEEMKRYGREPDLTDTFYESLDLTVRAVTDYQDSNVALVEVQVRYEGNDENNQHVEKDQTFTFTSGVPQKWNPSLIGAKREYEYRYRIGFTNTEFTPYSEWTTTTGDLNILISAPAKVMVDVVTGNVDFVTLVDRVHVTLAYEDTELGVPREEYTILLTPSKFSDHYERLIYKLPRHPVSYRVRFDLKSGEVLEDGTWRKATNQIVIDQPFVDLLRVNLLPTGDGWDDVVQVIVDMRYEDMLNHYIVEESIPLKSRDEFRIWKVVLRDKGKKNYDYRVNASFKNRPFQQTGWQNSTEDTLFIEIKAPPRIKILIMADALDFTVSPLTEVTLRSNAAGANQTGTFVFKDKTPQAFIVNVPSLDTPIDYSYQVTHYPVGHDPVVLPEVDVKDSPNQPASTVIVLPPYRPSKTGRLHVEFRSQLVDFDKTPIVTVDLVYDDVQNGIHEIGSLTFDKKQTLIWEIDVKDVNQKLFCYTITYYTSSQTYPLQRVCQERTSVIIPAFSASAVTPSP